MLKSSQVVATKEVSPMSESPTEQDESGDAHDQHLARQIQRGSKAAFETLFRRYCGELCVFAERYIGTPETAEDLVHDVFCDVWDRRALFHPAGTVRSYLFQAVRNKAYNRLKRRRVRREWRAEYEPEPPSASPRASHAAEYADLERAMERAVDRLSERQRAVYRLGQEHGLSYVEIAAVLDITPKTVENHMGRALKRLREHLVPFLSSLVALLDATPFW
jgi:RNA polymerase sigma-70 factor (ECF subfamily)